VIAFRRIVLVVAADEHDVIGRDGGMPWRLPDDLKHFKSITSGYPIVMGRRTWDELGGTPLPKRHNIVLTRDTSMEADGCTVVHEPKDALEAAGVGDVMIIGGGQVYRLFLDQATHVELTRVHARVDGDTTFPKLDDAWTLESTTRHETDDQHDYAFTFERWKRRDR
jgi:dihydrofolate reductase